MPEEIKIYTKKGDKGETSLLGGNRVPKYHDRIEAYGTLDEMNSFIGLLRDYIINQHYKDVLLVIQHRVFDAEAILASDQPELTSKLPHLKESDIVFLENEIDEMNSGLPILRNFILPGGNKSVSLCHVARTICRRAERLVVKLAMTQEIEPVIIRYLNRLSDYFFVLSRKIASDLNVEVITWAPGK